MLRLIRLVTWAVGIGAALAPAHARAEFPKFAGYVGVTGGINGATRRWDIGTGQNGYPGKDVSGLAGIRLGMHLHQQLAIEGQLAYIPLQGAGETNSLLSWDFSLLVHLLRYDWTPTLNAGLGGYSLVSGKLGSDTDLRGHMGVGVRGLVLPWLAVRSDLRVVFSDGFDTPGALNLEWTLGVDFYPWRKTAEAPPPPPPADRDKDGIADAEDVCPDEPGPKATSGLPGQGRRRHPGQGRRVPGPGRPQGDQGLPGPGRGRRPRTRRTAARTGPARRSSRAARTRDGDGLADIDDRCPNQAGPQEPQGLPGQGRRHVPDIDDKCPDVAGLAEAPGLPAGGGEEVHRQHQGHHLRHRQRQDPGALEQGARPGRRGAQGVPDHPPAHRGSHRQRRQARAKNQKLSQARADSVKAYLEKKGIDADRLEAVGYGDTKPMTSNKSKAGRAQNRRIEFTALSPAAPASK